MDLRRPPANLPSEAVTLAIPRNTIFESTLDENDEELPSELISSLEKLRAILDSEARVVHACIPVGFFQ